MKKIPVIDVTDLYHPYQDPGDNVDILTAFALPEIDLRAVILDITEEYRHPTCMHPIFGKVEGGPREPGIVPVCQCNYLFGRSIPVGIGPFRRLSSETDTAADQSPFHNGVDLLLQTLRAADEPVHILVFGSARVVAAAFNRDPQTMLAKTACVHLSAGASGPYLEWNVLLDPHAYVRVLRSGLPLALYPCATANGPFDIGAHNTYWQLKDRSVFLQMDPPLRRYLTHVFTRNNAPDFLRCLENDREAETEWAAHPHAVWETAVWMQLAGRELVHTPEGCRYLPKGEGTPALCESLLPCRIHVEDSGLFTFELTNDSTNVRIYHRTLPDNLNALMTEAYNALHLSYRSCLGS